MTFDYRQISDLESQLKQMMVEKSKEMETANQSIHGVNRELEELKRLYQSLLEEVLIY